MYIGANSYFVGLLHESAKRLYYAIVGMEIGICRMTAVGSSGVVRSS
jgi:hypothetical protein